MTSVSLFLQAIPAAFSALLLSCVLIVTFAVMGMQVGTWIPFAIIYNPVLTNAPIQVYCSYMGVATRTQ